MSQLYRSAESRLQYEICVRGHLGPHWSDWFEGFAIAPLRWEYRTPRQR
ncbi:MAG: hypothetical protein AAFN42_17115 [Cyanobacteria bacterium J06554_1]